MKINKKKTTMKVEIRVIQLQAMNAKTAYQTHAAGKRQGRIPLQVSKEHGPAATLISEF